MGHSEGQLNLKILKTEDITMALLRLEFEIRDKIGI